MPVPRATKEDRQECLSSTETMSIECSEAGGIVTLRLAHGKAAALDIELLEALQRELFAAADARAHAVILTGSASSRSCGAPRGSGGRRSVPSRSIRGAGC